tara:strand:- start:42 stop:548 length:507 start_codon:yes stop_codon:yes gene_type:complete
MKNSFFFIAAFLVATPSLKADIHHSISKSVKLSVDAAASTSTRLGSSYSVSGNNVKVVDSAQFGGLTAPGSITAPATMIQADFEQHTEGSSFSFSEAFNGGDSVDTDGTTVTNGVTPALPAFGSTTTYAGGVNTGLAGTITSQGVLTITPGSAGTHALGQVISEISVD